MAVLFGAAVFENFFFIKIRFYEANSTTSPTENRFECSECGHFFPVKASLERHQKTVHNPTKVRCLYCPASVKGIANHLTVAHGLDPKASRTIALELDGKSSARTNIPFVKS